MMPPIEKGMTVEFKEFPQAKASKVPIATRGTKPPTSSPSDVSTVPAPDTTAALKLLCRHITTEAANGSSLWFHQAISSRLTALKVLYQSLQLPP
jgi:hypothetical protein